jgi:hypothetical protein
MVGAENRSAFASGGEGARDSLISMAAGLGESGFAASIPVTLPIGCPK